MGHPHTLLIVHPSPHTHTPSFPTLVAALPRANDLTPSPSLPLLLQGRPCLHQNRGRSSKNSVPSWGFPYRFPCIMTDCLYVRVCVCVQVAGLLRLKEKQVLQALRGLLQDSSWKVQAQALRGKQDGIHQVKVTSVNLIIDDPLPLLSLLSFSLTSYPRFLAPQLLGR